MKFYAKSIIIIVSFGSLVAILLVSKKDPNIDKCQAKLKVVYGGVTVMRDDYGRYPTNLESVLEYFNANASNSSLLNCPGTRHFRKTLLPIKQPFIARNDYLYFDWSSHSLVGVSNDWPLIVDRGMQNHGGKGLNVCLVNGDCFWDPGAKWFREFTNKYANLVRPR